MNKQRLALMLALLLSLPAPLAACGSKSSSSSSSPSSSPAIATSASAAKGQSTVKEEPIAYVGLEDSMWFSPDEDSEENGFYLEFPSKTRCYITWVQDGEDTAIQRFGYTVVGQEISLDKISTGSISEDLEQMTFIMPDGTTRVFVPSDRVQKEQPELEQMVGELHPIYNSNGSRFKETDDDANQQGQEKDSGFEDQVMSSSAVKLSLPGAWAQKGLSWSVDEKSQSASLDYTGEDGVKVSIAQVLWGDATLKPAEVKSESVSMGKATVKEEQVPVSLRVPFVDEAGKTIPVGSEQESTTMACDYYDGLSVVQVETWIELAGDDEDARAKEMISHRKEEFCGVWAYASKNVSDALRISNEARQRGFAAEVFKTTDWENLSEEPWFVVSLGCAYSESEATRVVEMAHQTVYQDAYVMWTGDYVG